MPITSIASDPQALTLVATGDYPVPVERLWQAWADPRQLERFWGPPQWPATFTRHELREGGRSEYYMTGPEGQRSAGYWLVERVEEQRAFTVRDGFSGEEPISRLEVTFEATPTGSRFVARSSFPSVEAMERLLAMGMLEGLSAAMAQLDLVLADLRQHSAEWRAALTVVDATHVVVRRVVRGTIDQVWRAHQEPALLQRWLLGPAGWTMPVCEVAARVGERYRYEWEHEASSQRFGFEGELLELEPPRRAVTTERMIGREGEPARNELLLSPRPGDKTLIECRIEYPSRQVRDAVLGTGMVTRMEASYARLEDEVLAARPGSA
ncbi:MAG: SRPBCC domain-containing protein [Planctomycetota bacterium]